MDRFHRSSPGCWRPTQVQKGSFSIDPCRFRVTTLSRSFPRGHGRFRMHHLLTGVLIAAMAAAPATPAAASAAAEPRPVDLVHPFVGTENFGNTFPGASAPFGMVQVSPDTGGQGGYDYRQDSIYGFSQT